MNRHVRDVYLYEGATQCNFALNAMRGLNNVLSRLPDASRSGNRDLSRTLQQEVFRSIHSFLTHLSNVSRLFWPGLPNRRKREPEGKYKERCRIIQERGRILRGYTGLPDRDHPLRARRLRDHLEHFDERLDDWQQKSIRMNIVQDFIGPEGAIAGIEDSDMMRWFDPSTNTFRFRGEQFCIQELVSALDDLLNIINEVLNERRESA